LRPTSFSRARSTRANPFSQVIKQRFGGSKTGADLLRGLDRGRLSAEALDNLERLIMQRRGDLVKAPKL
jgi:hypothetical protein